MFDTRYIATAPMVMPRRLYLSLGDDLTRWPTQVPIDPPFNVVTAFDAHDISSDTLGAFATLLFEQGCVEVCSWGEDCSRVHDCFDEALNQAEERGSPFDPGISTEWFARQPLRDAVLYAVHMAFHEDRDVESVLVVASTAYADEAASLLEQPDALWAE